MPPDPKPLRTFIAVEFSAETQAALAACIQLLRPHIPAQAVSWVKPNLLHLTLKFLGPTPPDKVDAITTALTQALEPLTAFAVSVQGLGGFPNLKRPRVLWVGFDPQAAQRLQALNQQVEAVIAPLGFPTESRPFSPHLTLGRIRREATPAQAAQAGAALQNFRVAPLAADRVAGVAFIKSELFPSGPVYTVLERVTLRGHNA